jgi:MGT family glycosyltransferase
VWGRLAQQITGLPAITLASVFVPNEDYVSVDDLVRQAYGQVPREVLLAGIDALNTYLQTSQRLDRRYRTRSPNIVEFFANRQPLNVLFTSKLFHLAGESYDDRYVFVGPSVAARAGEEESSAALLERIDRAGADKPLVYVSLGTIFNDHSQFFRACLDAFGSAPWTVVVSTGSKVDREALGAVPENVILQETVPQLTVLGRASLCLTHGGMNTTSEALWHGVPLLVFPQHGDQHLVATRVTALGAGLRVTPADLNPGRLRELAARVLNESEFKRHAARIAASFHDAGGCGRAADAIQAYVARVRQPVSDDAATVGAAVHGGR